MSLIADAIREAQQKRAALLEEYPELANDVLALNDTLEGEIQAPELIGWLVRKAIEQGGLADMAQARAELLVARAERFTKAKDALLRTAVALLDGAGLPTQKFPDFTFGKAALPVSVVINDEALIPDIYMTTPEPKPPVPKPNKAAIKLALESKQQVPGASLSNGGIRPNLKIT